MQRESERSVRGKGRRDGATVCTTMEMTEEEGGNNSGTRLWQTAEEGGSFPSPAEVCDQSKVWKDGKSKCGWANSQRGLGQGSAAGGLVGDGKE